MEYTASTAAHSDSHVIHILQLFWLYQTHGELNLTKAFFKERYIAAVNHYANFQMFSVLQYQMLLWLLLQKVEILTLFPNGEFP